MAFKHGEFDELLKSVKDFQSKYDQFVRLFMEKMGGRAIAVVKKHTPVGAGGFKGEETHMRNRWELSEVFRQGDDYIIFLINPAEYASFVEDGHMQYERWVPGYWESGGNHAADVFVYDPTSEDGMMLTTKWIPGVHMARMAITKINLEIPKRWTREFNKFIESMELV